MSTDINVAFNNKKLTIDFLVPCGGRGGVENVLNDTALYLKSLGIRVRVIQLVYNDYSWPDSSLEYYTINIDRAISDFLTMCLCVNSISVNLALLILLLLRHFPCSP